MTKIKKSGLLRGLVFFVSYTRPIYSRRATAGQASSQRRYEVVWLDGLAGFSIVYLHTLLHSLSFVHYNKTQASGGGSGRGRIPVLVLAFASLLVSHHFAIIALILQDLSHSQAKQSPTESHDPCPLPHQDVGCDGQPCPPVPASFLWSSAHRHPSTRLVYPPLSRVSLASTAPLAVSSRGITMQPDDAP